MKRRSFILSLAAAAAAPVIPSFGLQAPELRTGEMYGLFVSNDGKNIRVQPGRCRDQADTCDITISEARIPAEPLHDGTWHMYAISGSGVEDDVIFSTQARNPDLPEGYTAYRRLASLLRFKGKWPQFEQHGAVFSLAS